jgi:pimeloyl-ACP methyl ester carboxylesterase
MAAPTVASSRMEVVEAAGPFPQVETPEAVNERILGWLR